MLYGVMATTAIVLYSCSTDSQDETLQETAAEKIIEVSEVEDFGTFTTVPIEGRYIVVLHKGSTNNSSKAQVTSKARSVLAKAGISKTPQLVFNTALRGFVVEMSKSEAGAVAKNGDISYIEQDRMIILKPGKGKPGGGGGGSQPQETPWGIDRVGGAADGSGLTAWVIDTGIDLDHADLNVNGTDGFSAFTRGKDAGFDDGNGHGTHVAGTIAAKDNTIGIIGVAAGATVVPVKVLNRRGSGSNSGVIAGVDHVAANGSTNDVANMSLGGGVSSALDQAVQNAAATGIKFVLAAGNESDDANNHSPARANGANIYTISASDINDNFASFSNYGSAVDYCAPGVSIASTWKDGGYNTISGTSMASPHAAGVILLGNPSTDGFVNGDPDGNPDPIIHR
ncbi:peptidase S8 [Sediminicola luteus]|uniref:Peptidase S8 n=2 Tax=Sediminicola luteus TaxID=319238 RepID=A0A2A4GFI4_9FLAO|nr:peptidase S8 [Sediminicola luteus]